MIMKKVHFTPIFAQNEYIRHLNETLVQDVSICNRVHIINWSSTHKINITKNGEKCHYNLFYSMRAI